MLNKIFDKNNKNLSVFCSLIECMFFYGITLLSFIHGADDGQNNLNERPKYFVTEDEVKNDGDLIYIRDIIPNILEKFHQVSPVFMEFHQKSSDVKNSIALSSVCKKWRGIILDLRYGNNCKLCIPESKKLIEEEDYKAIQESGYRVIDIYSQSLEPKNVFYLNYLINVTHLNLLPPKPDKGTTENNQPPKQWIKSDVMQSIRQLKNLTILNLASNHVVDKDLESLINLINIEKLNLSFNNIKDDFVLKLSSLINLKYLNLCFLELEDNNYVFKKLTESHPCCKIIGLGQSVK